MSSSGKFRVFKHKKQSKQIIKEKATPKFVYVASYCIKDV